MTTKKHIFLVEDDTAIVDIYKTLMEKSGFQVSAFGMGQEVINAIKSGDTEKKPDIILLDLILPDMNGVDILREIRKEKSAKEIKVFILTNQSEAKFDDVQPDKVIIKAHITPTQLIKIIKEAMQ